MKPDWKTSEFLTPQQADELFDAQGGAYLEQALKEGLNPQMSVQTGFCVFSLFGYALSKQHVNVVETMLNADKSLVDSTVCWTSRNKDSALMYAVTQCNFSLVEVLFRYGLDARNLRDNVVGRICSSTCYDEVKRHEQSKIIHFLIDKGCSANKLDYAGKTALMTYLSNRSKSDISVIDKLCRVQSWDINQPCMGLDKTVLHIAAEQEKLEALSYFLREHNADITVIDKYGYTPLCVAIMKGKEKAADLLIAAGSDVSAVDNAGCSILEHACCGYQNALEEDYKNRHGMQNIHQSAVRAAYKTQKNIIRKLIQNGADVNIPTADSRPLISAVLAGDNLGIAKLLIDAGANLYDIDKNGVSVMDSIEHQPQKLAFVQKMVSKQKRDSLKKENADSSDSASNPVKEKGYENYLMDTQNLTGILFDKYKLVGILPQPATNIGSVLKVYRKLLKNNRLVERRPKNRAPKKFNKNAKSR